MYGNEYKLGKYAIATRLKIYKTVVFPAIYHNIETWSNISKNEMNELEKIQCIILKRITEQRITTPHFGLLSELGIWPIEKQIQYKKIMLLHSILTSQGERTLKDIIEEQINNTWKGCWIEQTREICSKYNIEITNIKNYNKYKLKKILKETINKHLNEELQREKEQKTKLRFLNEFKQEKYLDELQYNECVEMLKIKLNMIETKCNYKGNFKNDQICEICKVENDTTEHILECRMNKLGITMNAENIITSDYNILGEIKKVMDMREKLGFKINIGEADDEIEEEV